MNKQFGLGRGLDSLIPAKIIKKQDEAVGLEQRILEVSPELVDVNPLQPRKEFGHGDMEELINSIKEHGIIQPLIVTERGGRYELIAGERRLRSAKILNLKKVPVLVRRAKDQQKLELALVENLQRKNLNPIEEAVAYGRLMDEFNLTQEEVARKVGRSRPAVANSLRLLGLPEEIKQAIMAGKISESHARSILGLEDKKDQLELFKKIMRLGLTVGEVSKIVKEAKDPLAAKEKKIDVDLIRREERLREALGTKVEIKRKGRGGQVIIDYYSEEELGEIINKILK